MPEPLLICLQGLLLIGLVCLSAFFSSSEIALFSLSRAKLMAYKDDPSVAKRRIHSLMSDYHGTLISIIFGNMFVNSLLSMLNEELLSNLHLNAALTSVLSALMGIVLLLLFGEITPMSIAYIHAERWSACVATPIWLLRKATFPVVSVVEALCNKVLDLLGRKRPKPLDHDEYLSYLETCLERGAFPVWEAKLLRSAFALRYMTVESVMRSRVDLPLLKPGDSPERVASIIMASKQAQLPVGASTLEEAELILSSRSFFMLRPEERKSWWSGSCVSKAVFIPAASSLTKALRTLRAKGVHAGIATDEYGGFAGLVSLQDVYSELVGRAGEDEDGTSGWQAFRVEPGKWLFDGLCPLAFVEESSGWKAPEGVNANTIGGLLCELLGTLPEKGSSAQACGATLHAASISGSRVFEVLLTIEPEAGSVSAQSSSERSQGKEEAK